MPDILLCTLNATWSHASLALRYLRANLGELEERSAIVERTLEDDPRDIVEELLGKAPRIIGFGVYVWNVVQTEAVVALLKQVAPDVLVVLGGPEVSHEVSVQSICRLADCVLAGEADLAFAELCRDYLIDNRRPASRVVHCPLPPIGSIASPYRLYSDTDIAHRTLYVEASRGCPYKCEFCLSALDEAVRNFPLDAFLDDLDRLIARGARQFKFVDRTFNLGVRVSTRILQFFLERIRHGLFLHFEIVPDRLPGELKELLIGFPPGSLQFEVGVQTFNDEVTRRISRPQDYDRIRDNLAFLRRETKVHIHSDLIVGLPGETLSSFGAGFDQLAALGPHEIQVGILKRLRGAPIERHDEEWAMVYDRRPPYAVVKTRTMSFDDIQCLGRFARLWDHYANRGNFPETIGLLGELGAARPVPSLFAEFLQFTDWLRPRFPKLHSIALVRLAEAAWEYLTGVRNVPEERARAALASDYLRPSGREIPPFLVEAARARIEQRAAATPRSGAPPRQQKHLSG